MTKTTFSARVKEELCTRLGPDKESQMAELAALIQTAGRGDIPRELLFQSEQAAIIRKVGFLAERLFSMTPVYSEKADRAGNPQYRAAFREEASVRSMLKALGIADGGRAARFVPEEWTISPAAAQGYARGAFLGSGSVTDPQKNYHVEFVSQNEEYLRELGLLLGDFGLEMHRTTRSRPRPVYVLYLKESEQIADLLNVMQAHTAAMELVNVQIEKDMRNQVNRSVNCEASNLRKVVQAALKQQEDIRYVVDHLGWEALSPQLAEAARIRLDYPEESLSELGEHFDPPVGRSGVNHRLRKLTDMARVLRNEEKKSSAAPENGAKLSEEEIK